MPGRAWTAREMPPIAVRDTAGISGPPPGFLDSLGRPIAAAPPPQPRRERRPHGPRGYFARISNWWSAQGRVLSTAPLYALKVGTAQVTPYSSMPLLARKIARSSPTP